ncbi:MAG: iron ABC transporter permease [Elusimicrobia bacterium]|nr:iron ABC transporter permease [Elusimicrobiota bacterium]
MKQNNPGKILWLVPALMAAAALSLLAGAVPGAGPDIIWGLRFPRILAGVTVGAGLGFAGAVFQGLLKNPLSDPYILGTSAGAMAGAVFCSLLGISRASFAFYLIVFAGAFSATFLTYSLARIKKYPSVAHLVLAGVAVSTFFTALIMLALTMHREHSLSLIYFLLGGFYASGAGQLAASAFIVIAAVALGSLLWRYLDIFSLGEEKASYLGADPDKIRLAFFALASAATAAAVALAGTVGFVGLIVPHILRLIFGASHRRLLVSSALGGALFLVLADAIARSAAAPLEIPVGIVTAICGAPFFIWLLRRTAA